jgi:glycerol-3-phosphate acyltransferase PlsY
MNYIIVILISYAIGSISPARIITHKVLGIDIRNVNSKSAGTSNAVMTLGFKYGALVGFLDLIKGLIPVLIVKLIFPNNDIIWFVSGLFIVLGHIYPIYMGFHGGKGTASLGGVLFAIAPIPTLILVVIFTVLTIVTDYIALSTVIMVSTVPIYMFFSDYSYVSIGIVLFIVFISFYKHFPNLKRIMKGQEVGLKEGLSK